MGLPVISRPTIRPDDPVNLELTAVITDGFPRSRAVERFTIIRGIRLSD